MIAEMVRGFDPYRAWLNVCEMRRPLTAYQILDLPALESDLGVIREAVGLKRASLELHRDEAPPEIWSQIHGELEEAVDILLDPEKKIAYDMTLQSPSHARGAKHGPPGGVTDKGNTASLPCPICRSANPATRKFCAQCGASLWEPCLNCGTLCTAGERFCGACGSNLNGVLEKQIKQLEAIFFESRQLQSVSRYDDAIKLLTDATKIDHPRLTAYVHQANQFIGQLGAQKARRKIVADDALQRAEQCFARGDCEGTVRIVESVPRPLRSEAMLNLLGKIEEQTAEITRLETDLRTAVQENRVLAMPSMIERLLELRPDHIYAKQLGAQVHQRLIAAAEKRLSQQRFDEALQLIEKIAPHLRSAEAEEVRRKAAELSCLVWDLHNAPVIDETLVAVGRRLEKAAAADSTMCKLCRELQRRQHEAQEKRRLEPISWATPPKDTIFNVPIDWHAGFRRVVCADAFDPSSFVQNPGRFAVACGLALAGIKQAAIGMNLMAARQKSVWNRVSGLMQTRITLDKKAWGLDVGCSGLRAVKLSWNDAKKQAVVESALSFDYAKPLNNAMNEIEEKRLVADAIKAFMTDHETKNERICVALPGRLALMRQFRVPPTDQGKTEKIVQNEARHLFPFPLEQLAWDYHVLGSTSDSTTAIDGGRAVLLAVQEAAMQRFLTPFQQTGLHVDVLQTDIVALHNFISYEYSLRPDDSPQSLHTVAALDVGCDVTNIVVCSSNILWSHSCGVAGHTFTKALAKEFGLGFAQAEHLKCKPESAERLSEWNVVTSSVLEDLACELQQSLAGYAKAFPRASVERIIGLGGGFSLHGLFRYLRCAH